MNHTINQEKKMIRELEQSIEKYEQYLKSSGKDLTVILAEKMRGDFNKGRYLFLSETNNEWIIHPVSLYFRTDQDRAVSTGNGTYMFKDRYSYEDAKATFQGRL
jgi:hypothetical protein